MSYMLPPLIPLPWPDGDVDNGDEDEDEDEHGVVAYPVDDGVAGVTGDLIMSVKYNSAAHMEKKNPYAVGDSRRLQLRENLRDDPHTKLFVGPAIGRVGQLVRARVTTRHWPSQP